MANKYRKKLPKAESEASQGATAPGEELVDPMDMGMGAGMAAVEGVLSAVPGMKFVQGKIMRAIGGEEAEKATAAEQARLEAEHPTASAAGELIGAGLAGAAMPLGSGGAVAKTATAAAQAALMTPAYKLGEIANQAQLKGDALHVESIANAFSFQDSLEAAGLTALFGLPGLGMEAAGAIKGAAGRRASSEAAKLFPKAAAKLGVSEVELGERALSEGLLGSETAVRTRMSEAGKRMGAAVKEAKLDATDIERMTLDLVELEKGAENNQFLQGARKSIRAQAARLLNVQSGEELEVIIQSMKGEARAAAKAGRAQKAQFFGDAAETLRGRLAEHLDVLAPEAGAEYRAAVQDYNTYAKMAPEATAGARRQAKGNDIAKTAVRAAVSPAVGAVTAGPLGAVAGLAVDAALPAVTAPLRGKNTAVLMQRISKAAPGAMHLERAAQVTDKLLGAAAAEVAEQIAQPAEADVPRRYADVAKALRSSMANPSGTAKQIRAQLDFLPPHVADAVAANSMNKLQCLALALPPENGPATAFGIKTDVPDRAKREFLRRASDAFDPYGAVLSGSPMRVREAEKYNPETINDLRKRVIDKIAENPNLPYSTKRRVAGILGVAGVPTQDPMVGATVQQILRKRREAQDSQGQMKSARQANANLKNNSATLTRAQKILNQGE